MAGYERKDLQGAAFKNESKVEDWHADYRGDILVDGHDYYVDITKKMSAKGQPYLQVKLKSKGQSATQAATGSAGAAKQVIDDFDL
jgi:hypothetical protein